MQKYLIIQIFAIWKLFLHRDTKNWIMQCTSSLGIHRINGISAKLNKGKRQAKIIWIYIVVTSTYDCVNMCQHIVT